MGTERGHVEPPTDGRGHPQADCGARWQEVYIWVWSLSTAFPGDFWPPPSYLSLPNPHWS